MKPSVPVVPLTTITSALAAVGEIPGGHTVAINGGVGNKALSDAEATFRDEPVVEGEGAPPTGIVL